MRKSEREQLLADARLRIFMARQWLEGVVTCLTPIVEAERKKKRKKCLDELTAEAQRLGLGYGASDDHERSD